MKLIDKFLTASRIDGFLNNEEVIAATNVTIADKYAIDFARWILAHPMIFNNGSSMEQAIEIYKIEKGL
jgi:hypothetical protein